MVRDGEKVNSHSPRNKPPRMLVACSSLRESLTATGGKTSHAAVVARGWGRVLHRRLRGATCSYIDYKGQRLPALAGSKTIHQGDWITLDGHDGVVYEGQINLMTPELPAAFSTLMGWADSVRKLHVRANADTAHDASKAREMGAEGIGLVRTEHVFFKDFEFPEKSIERQLAIQEMIIADSPAARKKALDQLLPYQRRDFVGIFKVMDGFPVTIRLIDPPLHEFVPHEIQQQRELAEKLGVNVNVIQRRVEQLHETNPMLGHRGSRLTITFSEILEMQVRAIVEAMVECKKKKITGNAIPGIMIPLVMDRKELQILTDQVHKAGATDILRIKSES